MFSATWKPKKSHAIKGPAVQADSSNKKTKGNDSDQRDKLGLNSKNPGGWSNQGKKYAEPSSAMERVEVHICLSRVLNFLLCVDTTYYIKLIDKLTD